MRIYTLCLTFSSFIGGDFFFIIEEGNRHGEGCFKPVTIVADLSKIKFVADQYILVCNIFFTAWLVVILGGIGGLVSILLLVFVLSELNWKLTKFSGTPVFGHLDLRKLTCCLIYRHLLPLSC